MSNLTTVVNNIVSKVNTHTTDLSNKATQISTHIPLSGITAYHLLQGNLAVSASIITQGFNTTLYTGNGSTLNVTTGIDMDTQWGNSSEERFGGLVWLKDRVTPGAGHVLADTIRGVNKYVQTNTTNAETSLVGYVTAFNNNGFSIGNQYNINLASIASWNFQTTHRVSGTTNHGMAYECHYNPFTGFTMVKYTGSGLAGHEIPHHLGRKLGFVTVKNLSTTSDWFSTYLSGDNYLYLNLTTASQYSGYVMLGDIKVSLPNNSVNYNASTNQYIMYGWANSYLDESDTLIGNYEIGVYQGTGASGNKVTTRGKPAWVMIKRLDSVGDWLVFDNKRGSDFDNILRPNSSVAEGVGENVDVVIDGFILTSTDVFLNASGGQYLYMVAYDTNSNGGGSYYPLASDTANVQVNNALIPIAQGIDSNGAKNTILSKNETFSGVTYTQGKNYPYYDALGNRGVSNKAPNYGLTNPANGGDFYNVLSNKWFTSAGTEITNGRNYLNHIVYADNDGGVLYVEELPKIEYKDIVKANEFKGKNACTAWVNFDGTTTPPTIRDSYNVSAVIRTSTGVYDVYFKEPMDNTNYTVSHPTLWITSNGVVGAYKYLNKVTLNVYSGGTLTSGFNDLSIQIIGGKN